MTHEGVSANDGRRIRNGRSATDLGGSAGWNSNTGEAQPWPAAKSTPTSSVRGARVRQTGNRGHPRARGKKGVALRSRRRPEGKAGARAPWPAAWSTPASADKGLWAMIQNGNWMGRKRRARQAHHGRKSEAEMKRGRRSTVSSGRWLSTKNDDDV